MGRTSAQRALEKRRHELRMDFLPRRFSKLGNYTDKQRHLAGAFRVFFNAELENYFEVVARLVASHAEAEWKAGRTTRAFAALCSRNSKNIPMPQETKDIDSTVGFLDRRFEKELEVQRQLINKNNGAKSHNILQMFVPLGINDSVIDGVLLAECDTLGSGRGFLAHKTAGPAIHLIDPRTEYDRAIKIVKMLDDFEGLLEL